MFSLHTLVSKPATLVELLISLNTLKIQQAGYKNSVQDKKYVRYFDQKLSVKFGNANNFKKKFLFTIIKNGNDTENIYNDGTYLKWKKKQCPDTDEKNAFNTKAPTVTKALNGPKIILKKIKTGDGWIGFSLWIIGNSILYQQKNGGSVWSNSDIRIKNVNPWYYVLFLNF